MDAEPTPISSERPGPLRSTLHVVRRVDLISNKVFDWDDPDRIAILSSEKRRAWVSNPLLIGDDDPVQIIGTVGRRVIGRLDLLAGEAWFKGQRIPMLWTSDLFVQEEFRKTMMGVSLVLKMQALHKQIGACGVSRMALPLFEKLGWRDFPMQRYLAVRHSRSVVQARLGAGAKARIVICGLDAGLFLHQGFLRLAAKLRTLGLHCQPLNLNDPMMVAELDAAFCALPDTPRFHRSAKWVRWVVEQSLSTDPRNHRVAFAITASDGRLVGYFLIRDRFFETATHRGFKNLTLGSLIDWSVFDPARVRLEQIILLANRALAQRGVDAVEICLPDEPDRPNLRRWGLVPVGDLHLLLKMQRSGEAHWTVRPADGDNAFG